MASAFRRLRIAVVTSPWVFAAITASAPAKAQDASFGCKVLLCALSSNPAWVGVPYCGPVMSQLFSILNSGGSWPTCDAASVSPVGYSPYEACPAGSSAVSLVTSRSGSSYVADSAGRSCATPIASPSGISGGCQSVAGAGSECLSISARPANPAPYFVDITTASGVQQFSFALSQ
jgi:hypothetical protein